MKLRIMSASLMLLAATGAPASEVLWSQPNNSNAAAPNSAVTTDPALTSEAADDFELTGLIERVVITGNDCFQCIPPVVAGVYVRFYQWTAEGPGALQSQSFVAAPSPGLLYDVTGPATLDITLPTPFAASGKHFMSVQVAFDGFGFWGWWTANNANPAGSALRYRENGGNWAPYETPLSQPLNADLSFMIWGDDGTPPPPGTDPCGTWSTPPTPIPAAATHSVLRDVVAVASDDAYAVGHYNKNVQGTPAEFAMAMHWNGLAWTLLDPPSPTACGPVCTYVDFEAAAMAGPDDLWAAGGKRVQAADGFLGTHIYVARYSGSSWTVMNTPLTIGGSGAHVQDIEVIAPDDIWFFGDWVGAIPPVPGSQPALAMHWNGSSFSVLPTPYPAGGTPGWGLEAGSALAPDDVWAVGGGSDGDDSFPSYIIHWNGSAWTHVPGPSPGNFQRLYDVKAIAPDDVWAVGDYFVAGQGYFALFLHWDGSSWTQVDSPGGGRSLVAFAPDNIYCGGAGIVHWDGESWNTVESFDQIIGPSIQSIAAADLCDMFAVGRQLFVGDVMNFSARLLPGAVGVFTGTGDVTGNGVIDIVDLLALLAAWGNCPGCPADVNGDGVVDVIDMLVLLGNWS